MNVLEHLACTPMKKTHTRSSDGDPYPDSILKNMVRSKVLYYRRLYSDRQIRSDPIVFMSLSVNTVTPHLYDDFLCLLFLNTHRETSALSGDLPEVSDQFRFRRTVCFAHLKGSVGVISGKTSTMEVGIEKT
jgi:hypothetical protein